MNENQKIYYLYLGRLLCGTFINRGPKNYKILEHSFTGESHTRYIAPERCAVPGESVCVVNEKWRGVTGLGGFRIERELYPEHRVLAEELLGVNPKGVEESAYGVLDQRWLWNYNRRKLTIRFDNYSDLEDPVKEKIRQAARASQWTGVGQWAKEIYCAELECRIGDEEDFFEIVFETESHMARFKLDFGVAE
jgi:hypothetical protein